MSGAAASERKRTRMRGADDLTAERNPDREKLETSVTENIQIPSDTANADKHKHKKKRKKEIPPQTERHTSTLEEDHTTQKTKKKKHKECEVSVPAADVVTLHKTHQQTDEESAENSKKKKRKRRKTEVSGDVENTPVSEVEDELGSGKEEDLSPEERRVLERKLKKIRKKEEKKKMKEEGKSTKQETIKTNVAEKQALEYLTCWSERRGEWRFQKTRQTWLLQHMYDSVKVPDSYFEVLLCYLKGLCGAARETSRQKAEVLERWEGQTEEETTEAEQKKHRAKLVLQTL